MNSIDKAVRNERDVQKLIALAQKIINHAYEYFPAGWPDQHQEELDALIARRAAEDRGEAKV